MFSRTSAPFFHPTLKSALMKKTLALLVSATALCTVPASSRPDDMGDFDSFMSDALTDFNSFIDEANRDFINFMRNPWKKYQATEPQEQRTMPEPETQPLYTPATDPSQPQDDTPRQLEIDEILDLTTSQSRQGARSQGGKTPQQTITTEKPRPTKPAGQTPKPKPQPRPQQPQRETIPSEQTPEKAKPAVPVPAPAPRQPHPLQSPGAGRSPITFGGITYHVSNAMKGSVKLNSLNEKSIADAYEALFATDYKPLVAELQTLRGNGLNNDWATFLFIKDLSEKYAGPNESKVLRQFLLNQLGYKSRVAIIPAEKRLTLYFAPNCELYGVVFVDINGTKYYDPDARSPYAFRMCEKESPSAKRTVDMHLVSMPVFNKTGKTYTRTGSGKSAALSATTPVPKELIGFYSRLPQCAYSVYATASVDPEFETGLLGALRPAIAGKSELEAAAVLLDYVQHAFDYATDDAQFGYEKPFFVEELFYYPQCDCEDRSVLYLYLVRKLLGLEAVLVEYPNHMATAVKFNSAVQGDYLSVNGKKYVVCDPTFIGAGVGMAMPQFKNAGAKVVKI